MALIDCSQCGKTVSDRATTCPNCGAPIAAVPRTHDAGEATEARKARRSSPIVLLGGLVLIVALILLLVKPRFFPSEPSPAQVGDTVRLLMQQKFDSDPAFSKFGLKVDRVFVVKESDNRYQGMATIRYENETHDVPVQIVAGPDGTMWKTEPGALLFVAQRELQKAFQNR